MQRAQRNSLRLLQWMMAASLALPVALFVIAASISYGSTRDIADREIERTLDVAHEHALKVFETIDRSLAELNEVVRGPIEFDKGFWKIPEAPGLGVEVDETAAARHPYKPEPFITREARMEDGTIVDW